MNYEKTIETNFLNELPHMCEFYYKLASRTSDSYKQDLYANMALFKSKTIAKRETAKLNQKDIRNHVYTKDSGSIVARLPMNSMGISINKVGRDGFDDGESTVLSDSSAGSQWLGEYQFDDAIDEKISLASFYDSFENPASKLYVAWCAWCSNNIPEEGSAQYKSLFKEIRLLETIALEFKDSSELFLKRYLWERTEYSRHEIRTASKEVEKYATDFFDVNN